MLLIFDFDGVIVDSMLLHGEVESEAYGKLGINIAPKELARRFAGISQLEVSRTLSLEHDKPIPADFDPEPLKMAAFTERLTAIPNISAALDQLENYSMCIASGSSLATLELCLPIVGLYGYFAPNIFSSEQVAKGKPAPDLFLLAAKTMGFRPEECLVIEDGVAGVQAAKAAGMTVFGFTGGCHCEVSTGDNLKAAGAELVFTNMDALPDLTDSFFKLK
jgi:HAD superfamily hydrolase (TIGR01509 family)